MVEVKHKKISVFDPQGDLKTMANIERDVICEALLIHNGSISSVAMSLKIGRSTLYRKIEEYKINHEIFKEKQT